MELAERLFADREREGLWTLLITGLILAGVAIVLNILLLPDTPMRKWRLIAWIIPVGGASLGLWLLRYPRLVRISGFFYSGLAAGYVGFAAYANYLSLDPGLFAPNAIVLLADYAAMGMVIAATALTLRPIYPIVTAIFIVGIYGVFLAVGFADPRAQFAVDYADFLSRPANMPIKEAGNIIFLLSTGFVVALAVRNARGMVREAVQNEVANRYLARYFSPNVVDRITGSGQAFPDLGANRQDVVILFSDLVGFTALSARLQPEEALALLSEYRGRMVDAIFEHSGTLDKFIGDGIMATFGTPDPDPNAATHAVEDALAMEAALERLNEEREARGSEPLQHRIGVHAGPALVGNVGTDKRLEFTVIGPSVNVASRVERACKDLNESLLVTASVQARAATTTRWRAVEKIPVDGRAEGLMLFAPETSAA